MKSISKKSIVLIVIIVLAITAEFVAFRKSQATKIVDVTATFVDLNNNVNDSDVTLTAVEQIGSGYYIELPEYINNKKVEYFKIEKKAMNGKDDTTTTKDDIKTDVSLLTKDINPITAFSEEIEEEIKDNSVEITTTNIENIENIENEIIENDTEQEITQEVPVEEIIENEITEEKDNEENTIKEEQLISEEIEENKEINNTDILFPGDSLYLTKDEISLKAISVTVKYTYYEVEYDEEGKAFLYNIEDDAEALTDKSNKDAKKIYELYESKIAREIDSNDDGKTDNTIIIEGLLPNDPTIEIEPLSVVDFSDKIREEITDNQVLACAYDINILYENEKFEPSYFEKNLKVTIKGLDDINELQQEVEVYHILDDNESKETVNWTSSTKDSVSFSANSFSPYAVALKSRSLSSSGNLSNASEWDGTIASSFRFGTGTQTNPYLISSAEELALLAYNVNANLAPNGYQNSYFTLITDINLNNLDWTPIGTFNNPFRGNFNGGGHTVININIPTDDSIPSYNYSEIESYGFFGAIGNSTNRMEIKNLQLDNIKIIMNAGGRIGNNRVTNSCGYNMGFVAGTMYNHASIKNVIVNSALISNPFSIDIRHTNGQMYVGGIAGVARNTPTSTTDPGAAGRYQIENCYANYDVDFDTRIIGYTTNGNHAFPQYLNQYAIGGILGTTYYQPVWPSNCMYTGTINADWAIIGPIFGTTVGANFNGINTLQPLWQGNQLGNLTATSYYTMININGQGFTDTCVSGTSTYRVSQNDQITYQRQRIHNMAYEQGINKGIYVSNFSTMLGTFNSYVSSHSGDSYLTWYLESGTNYYYFEPLFTVSLTKNVPVYTVTVDNPDPNATYLYSWYIDDYLDITKTTNSETIDSSWNQEYNVEVLVTDGNNYALVAFTVELLEIHIEFTKSGNDITGNLAGTGLTDPSCRPIDYTYQWYVCDIADEPTLIANENTNTLTNIDSTLEYRLVATNTRHNYMSAEGTYFEGDRIVVFVNYNRSTINGVTYEQGIDTNDGLTPETAVRTIGGAYNKLHASGSRSENIMVIMGNYNDTNNGFLNQQNSTTYNKEATITGRYRGVQWNTGIAFGGRKYLSAATTFMYLTFNGNTNGGVNMYARAIYTEGYSVTMGKGLVMNGMGNYTSGQGCIGNAVAFQLCGPFTPDANTLDNKPTECEIIILSGQYGRLLASGREIDNDRTPLGSATRPYKCKVTIDIQNGVTNGYDINLLTAGKNNGSVYGEIELNIVNGRIGRVIGGNLGRDLTTGNDRNPRNSFFGSTTINMSGGTCDELFGAGYGRNGSYDVYYYGEINLNITGGTVNNNVYGGGAGGVTGYNVNNGDRFNTIGENYTTSISVNIGGNATIDGNVFAGGYGRSELLSTNTDKLGNTYCNTSLIINGGTINGSVYGAGQGYNHNSNNYRNVAQTYGNTYVEIKGGTINGEIHGAGLGISGYPQTARLIGSSKVVIDIGAGNTEDSDIYGGANVAEVQGTTQVDLKSGTVSGNVYGGSNSANVTTSSTVNLDGATSTNQIFGGCNIVGNVANTYVNLTSGTAFKVYGGNNAGGTAQITNVKIQGAGITNDTNPENDGAVYGAGKGTRANTNKSNVTVTSCTGTIPNVFGGGENAGVTVNNNITDSGETFVTVTGSTIHIDDLYGGSNNSGNITASNVTVNSGTIGNVFGANNANGVTTTTNVEIKGGTITNVYGGGNQAETNTTNVTISGGTITKAFGGGNEDQAQNTNLTITEGTITDAFGGGNKANATYTIVNVSGGRITTLYGSGNEAGSNGTSGTRATTSVAISGGNITTAYAGANKNTNGTIRRSDIVVTGGTVDTVYGGNNTDGTTTTANVELNGGTSTTIYGGNNLGGRTTTTHVTITDGTVTDVYGGGNEAPVGNTNVIINKTVTGSVYGGGNAAQVDTTTDVIVENGNIGVNVYGGGNEGEVIGSTTVNIKNSTIGGSAFGGGNGLAASIYGNTEITLQGTTTHVVGHVFGGGNRATTGIDNNPTASNTVNITGGTIDGSVYGAANYSVTYGSTFVNIGKNAVNDASLENGNILIKGTVFGGGELNLNNPNEYDTQYPGVIADATINIDGSDHTQCEIRGSIFGEGNMCVVAGFESIYIKDLGSFYAPNMGVSIQRAQSVVIDHSVLSLSGTNDSTDSLHPNINFSFNHIEGDMKLKNNSTLYVHENANYLYTFTSCVDINGVETKAEVTLDSTGAVTSQNVDNRLYLKEGKNLNIATDNQARHPGDVTGMTFLGLFSNSANPSGSIGLYDKSYDDGDTITNAGTFSRNSIVKGKHFYDNDNNSIHDITIDGFYSNYKDESNQNIINVDYVGVSPPDEDFYQWEIGEALDVTTYEVHLTAAPFATLGTKELFFDPQGEANFSNPNTFFEVYGVTIGLNQGISLVAPADIVDIQPDQTVADSTYGLRFETGNSGWAGNKTTYFTSANGGEHGGDTYYKHDNTISVPSINIYLYHSENLSLNQDLGSVTVRFKVTVPVTDITSETKYIDVVVNMSEAIVTSVAYDGAITPGEKFSLFTSTETNITDKSKFSEYFALYIPNFSYIDDLDLGISYPLFQSYHRTIVSRNADGTPYVYPENTKITMIDFVTNEYFYYVVSSNDELTNKNEYLLSDFVRMGSDNSYFSDSANYNSYYDSATDTFYENFIFIVDFGEADIPATTIENTFWLQIRDNSENVLLSIHSSMENTLRYSLYKGATSTIDIDATLEKQILYRGQTDLMTVTTHFEGTANNGGITVYDTRYFDDKLGIKISIYDSNGNLLGIDSLLGLSFILDEEHYYPRVDGTTRIRIADKVTNVLSKITIDTTENTTLPTGDYTIKIESFGSPDGIYYGIESSDTIILPITIVDSTYGLKITVEDECKIVDMETGLNENGNKNCNVSMQYTSTLSKASIRVVMYRRNYENTYSLKYDEVDMADYFTDSLVSSGNPNEYLLYSNNDADDSNDIVNDTTYTKTFTFDDNSVLQSGTYRIVYRLYDDDNFIGEVYDYVVIK